MRKKIEYFEKSDFEEHTNTEYRHIWALVDDKDDYELIQTDSNAWNVLLHGEQIGSNISKSEIIKIEPALIRALKQVVSGLSIRRFRKFGDKY